MTRIAVLGANGQVGAELCLRLHAMPGIELVPVCRNRQGSAFLRSRGIACRHGHVGDAAQARGLIGDCAVIVNLVLMPTSADPAGARRAMSALIDAVASAAAPGAIHLFLSTMSVYGDREVGSCWSPRNSYGQDKRAHERMAWRAARRHRCATYVLRLGHVCGELQGITAQVRDQLRRGPVPVTDPGRVSNTTHVAAIADAVVRIAAGGIGRGTYDLMNFPQWTWQQVYAHEARMLALPLDLRAVGDRTPTGWRTRLGSLVGVAIRTVRGHRVLQRLASRLVPLLPAPLYRRLRVWNAIRSAGVEIAGFGGKALCPPLEATRRVPIRARAVPGQTPTERLLDPAPSPSPDPSSPPASAPVPWPADLPLAGPPVAAAVPGAGPCRVS